MNPLPTRESLIERLALKEWLTEEQLMQELEAQAQLEQDRIARFAEHNLSSQQTKAVRCLARGTKFKNIGAKIGTSSKRGENVIAATKDKTDIHSKFGLAQLHWGTLPRYIGPDSS